MGGRDDPGALHRSRSRIARRVDRMSVGQLLAATIGLLLVLAVLGIGLALIASAQLDRDRSLLLSHVGPARRAALSLESALVNEETGVRGYVLTGQASFLEPYRSGLEGEGSALGTLVANEDAAGATVVAEVEMVRRRAQTWRVTYVAPALLHRRRLGSRSIQSDLMGKQLFDAVRASLARLQGALEARDAQTRAELERAASNLELLLVLAAVLILGGVLAAGYLLRRTITLPLARLGAEARRVAGGEFVTPLRIASGPREIASVGIEIEAMRERIVEELGIVQDARAKVEGQAAELRRSNAELEQFAYVASHDLQEPLRKIASFCQALQSRYGGQLDDRADQYIDFAVDGAKRMQTLINDLLAFSRVGRGEVELEPVDLSEAVSAAESALAETIERSGARVIVGELPVVEGNRAQLTSLFQNLIGNAVKFRGAEAPVVRIEAHRQDEKWLFSCTDNGIGIDAEYAERIFLIFQRLHSRDSYRGTGIGLALCRKIVEYHGGHIWLDTRHTGGACFRFTLPTTTKENVR
jgi:signal transduction histidine kinase